MHFLLLLPPPLLFSWLRLTELIRFVWREESAKVGWALAVANVLCNQTILEPAYKVIDPNGTYHTIGFSICAMQPHSQIR